MTKETQKRIVVTGINGFVGKHLTRELLANDVEVIGIGQEKSAHDEIADDLDSYYSADLTKEWPVHGRIDGVIHLAGLAAVGRSFDYPQDYINLNSAMVTQMAEYYLRTENHSPRFVVVSSGAIYSPDQPMPLTEDSKLGITSPYAVSKILVENQCEYYREVGLDCVVVRPFNHTGPGQLGGFLIPDVIAQLQTGDEVHVGNIETKRDYTDVRDIARAYRMLALAPRLAHSTYNACSGVSTQGSEIVEKLKVLTGKPDAQVVVDESKVRPTDPADIYGSSARLREDTGWKPEISLDQTLSDCINS
ncbi:NAD-dependent epimerase/dehydratase family protein [Candidatus Saccharibacteria bacterium]|nr:NAD-dependent epimerase/dehydratase family protein [Candidatus Saccharibacteria bacterium]